MFLVLKLSVVTSLRKGLLGKSRILSCEGWRTPEGSGALSRYPRGEFGHIGRQGCLVSVGIAVGIAVSVRASVRVFVRVRK